MGEWSVRHYVEPSHISLNYSSKCTYPIFKNLETIAADGWGLDKPLVFHYNRGKTLKTFKIFSTLSQVYDDIHKTRDCLPKRRRIAQKCVNRVRVARNFVVKILVYGRFSWHFVESCGYVGKTAATTWRNSAFVDSAVCRIVRLCERNRTDFFYSQLFKLAMTFTKFSVRLRHYFWTTLPVRVQGEGFRLRVIMSVLNEDALFTHSETMSHRRRILVSSISYFHRCRCTRGRNSCW